MAAPPTYDLFVSYAAADRAWVEGYLLDAFEQAGVRYRSEDAFELGTPRLLEFERAIKESRRTLLVLSPAYLADGFNQFIDLLAHSYGLETESWPVIPLVLHPVTLPPRLAMLTRLDATDSADWSAVVERLCSALQHPVPGPAPKPPCPYPGMVPFSEQDARHFFGREREIAELRRRLRHQNYLFVIGPSGSGKSSLVFAGLVAELHRQQPGEWVVKTMRPGYAPLEGLVQVFDRVVEPDTGYAERVAALLAQAPGARRLLIIIDQFEELFTQTPKPDQTAFIATITALRQVSNCVLVPTMRADFYEDLMGSDLWPVDASQRLEIAPLRGVALRDAIARPAESLGVHLEAGLLERLLADAADEPGVLPPVQETMVLLWEWMDRRLVPLSTYEDLGSNGRSGLATAIAAKADAVFAALSLPQQNIGQRTFLRLVQFGEGRADTRRQQPVAALRAAGDEPGEFDDTLQYLIGNRLLTVSGEEKSAGEKKVDIAHEALIGGWPRLQGWITRQREAEQMRRRLEVKTEEWMRLGSGVGGLLDATELAEAEQWLASTEAAELGRSLDLSAFIAVSRRAMNPGWHPWGLTLLIISAVALASLLGLLYVVTDHLPDTLRIALWLAIVTIGSAGAIALLLQRKGDPYLGQRITQRTIQRGVTRSIAGAVCGIAIALWTIRGVGLVRTDFVCRNRGFETGDFRTVAMLNTNLVSFDADAINAILHNYPKLRSWIVSGDDLENCGTFFTDIVTLRRIPTGRLNEVSYSATIQRLNNNTSPVATATVPPGADDCGKPIALAYHIVDNLGTPSFVDIYDTVTMPTPIGCEPFVLLQEGFRLYQKGKYAEAEDYYRKALVREPTYTSAYYRLGVLYVEVGRYQQAIEVLRHADELTQGTFVPVKIAMANAFYRQGDQDGNYEQAEQLLNHVISIEPDRLDAYAALAAIYRDRQQYTQAQKVLDQARTLIPKLNVPGRKLWYPYVLDTAQGELAFHQEQWPEAISWLQGAYPQGNYFNEEIIYYLARSYEQMQDVTNACKYWRIYRTFPPGQGNRFLEDERRNDAAQRMTTLRCSL